LLDTFGQTHNKQDNLGFTPFQRALQNHAYEAIAYVAETHPEHIVSHESLELSKSVEKLLKVKNTATSML
jgi:hypothetical protein